MYFEDLSSWLQKQKIAHQPGLVQKPVTVHREGKTFERRQWVRPEEGLEPTRIKKLKERLQYLDNISLLELKINVPKQIRNQLESIQDRRKEIAKILLGGSSQQKRDALGWMRQAVEIDRRKLLEQFWGRNLINKEIQKRGLSSKSYEEELSRSVPSNLSPTTSEERALSSNSGEIEETLIGGVNFSSLVKIKDDGRGIWKSRSGESAQPRPDIPTRTQYKREAAAYYLAKIIGFDHLVPPTVVRYFDGDIGSIQLWIEHAETAFVDSLSEKEQYDAAFFDMIIGNEDRHFANYVLDSEGKLKLIDHGLTFPLNPTGKSSFLRSVFFKYLEGKMGKPKPIFPSHIEILLDLKKRKEEISNQLKLFLEQAAIDGMFARIENMLNSGTYIDILRSREVEHERAS